MTSTVDRGVGGAGLGARPETEIESQPEVWRRALAAGDAPGVTTSLDTNWDPAERWSGLAEVLGTVDVFLPDQAEVRAVAGALGGPDGDPEAAARRLARLGCHVVVKQGSAGALSVAPEGDVVRVPAVPVEPVDITGAGDSFDAGYLPALVAGVADEAERLRWAVGAGALSSRGRGGTASQATPADLRLLG